MRGRMNIMQENNGENHAMSPKNKRGISGSTLKLIAVFTMLIDHTAAIVLWRILINAANTGNGGITGDIALLPGFFVNWQTLYMVYTVMRFIGRIAFPIYCFLLIEGFMKTHDVKKYALRLGAFALISEIPFNLGLTGSWLSRGYQNVFFTLLIGLLTMIAFDTIEKRLSNKIGSVLLRMVAVGLGMALADVLNTDYAAIGVLCIMVMFIFRRKRAAMMCAGAVSFLWEITAPLAFIPLALYNGERGLRMKYVFYWFYPVHMLVLYLIAYAMGLGALPCV